MRYNTQQKKLLIDFLRANKEQSFSADEIALKISVGKSTIYRLITELAANGMVKKFNREGERGFFYQFINDDGECDCHFHMKCTDCGKILHMAEKASEDIINDIFAKESFVADKSRTIIFGKCFECGTQEKV